ncbi:MAG: DinB family protein [Acidobacteria bacterium]|nr:DinB family protein [Acidobacteriota bacterium]
MAIKDSLLPEYDQEMKTTRKLLERVPETEFAWKPHEKSMSMGRLAAHLVELPDFANAILDHNSYDIAGGGDRPSRPEFYSRVDLLAAFDSHVATTRAKIDSKSDSDFMSGWTLRKGDQVMFTLPKIAVLRTFLFNHSIHHRGQLSVYLRLQNVPVPAIYGPSADESS